MAACSFAVTVAPPHRLSLTRFLAFGDSITAGEVTVPVGVGTSAGVGRTADYRQLVVPEASYPTVLLNRLRQRYVAQAITVENAGQPSEATVDAYPRFSRTLDATQPEVLLLLVGYNALNDGARGVSQAMAVVEQMIRTARGRGVRVFVGTLTPSIQGRLRSQPPALILLYNDAIRAVASREGATLVDLYQACPPNVDLWIGVDGLHPTEAGYAGIADVFYVAITSALEVR